MHPKLPVFVLLTVLLCCAFTCGESYSPTVSVSPSRVECDASGGVFELKVHADEPWEATEEQTRGLQAKWYSLSLSRGVGDAVLTLSVEQNRTGGPRSGKIKFSSPGWSPCYISILQDEPVPDVTVHEDIELSAGEEGDSLAASWSHVNRALGYVLTVFATGETAPLDSVYLPGDVLSYDIGRLPCFLPPSVTYTGPVSVQVRAVFSNPLSSAESPLVDAGHSHFAEGSTESRFLVSHPRHLKNVAAFPSGHFLQTADIDMDGMEFSPLPPFSGVYDGDGHSISGIMVSVPQKAGLFEELTGGGILRGIHLVRPSVEATAVDKMSVAGALCAIHGTTLEGGGIFDCHTTGGSVKGANKQIGGLVGRTDASTVANMSHCSNDSTIVMGSGTSSLLGGLVGTINSSGSVESCNCRTIVSGSGFIGGIAGGLNGGATVRDCHFTGELTNTGSSKVSSADESVTGGIVSRIFNAAAGIVECCSFSGVIFSDGLSGGIVGRMGNQNAVIRDCLASCNFISSNFVDGTSPGSCTACGGIAGTVFNTASTTSTIQRCLSVSCFGRIGKLSGGVIAARNTDTAWAPSKVNVEGVFYDATLAPGLKPFAQEEQLFPGAARTTEELKRPETFAGWDFDNVWKLESGDYPSLR